MNYWTCFFYIILMGVMFPDMSRAQKSKKGEKNIISSKINQIAKKYGDTISHLSQYYKTKWKYSKSDTLANPFYFHLFSPTIVSSEQFKGMLSRPNDAKDGQVQQEIEKSFAIVCRLSYVVSI